MPHRRPPKTADVEYYGYVRIFFTMCTFRKQQIFISERSVALIRRVLLTTAAEADIEILAYCFMPDHLHFLSSGAHIAADTKRFVTRFRQRGGFAFRGATGARLWQEG